MEILYIILGLHTTKVEIRTSFNETNIRRFYKTPGNTKVYLKLRKDKYFFVITLKTILT